MRRFALRVAGKEVHGLPRQIVRSPVDGSEVAEIALATVREAKEAVSASVEAFRSYSREGAYRRAELLEGIVTALAARREEFVETIVAEAAKPVSLARVEVERALGTFRLAAEESRRIGGELLPLDRLPDSRGRLGVTSRFPRGPVLAITPFNFPLNLVAHKVAPALACGASVILKPAPQAPVTALLLEQVCREASLPESLLQVLPAPTEVAEALVDDPRLPMVTFTGSAAVGWRIAARATGRKVLLELGGNASALVEPDADLPWAAARCALGAFAYGGQVCISLQHLLVHESVYEPFRALFLEEVGKIGVGDPRDEKTLVGPLISEEAARRVESWIAEAAAAGARVVAGGKRSGSVVTPTVLEGTEGTMKVGCEEVFGPVVTLDRYSRFDEALARVNSSPYGLQAGIFSKDVGRLFAAFRELEVGAVIGNDFPTYRADHMPYGGVKQSGLGREGVRYAIEEMTEPRLLVLNLS